MSPTRWQRLKAIYESALSLERDERDRFLKQACQGDSELHRELRSLLDQSNSSDDTFLEQPAWQVEASDASPPPTPRHPFLKTVAIITAALLVLFAYAAWRIPRDVTDVGWTEVRRQGTFVVDAVDPNGPAAGRLEPADRVLAWNEDKRVLRAGTRHYRRSLALDASYRLTIQRGSTTIELVLPTVRRKPDLGGRLWYFSIGLAWCSVGLFIGFARPQDPVARIAFLAAAMAGANFLIIGTLPGFFNLAPLHGVLGYHFFYRFPSERPQHRLWAILLGLVYCLGALSIGLSLLRFSQLQWFGPAAGTAWDLSPLAPTGRMFINTAFGLSMLAAVACAIHRYRHLTDPDHRRRFHWVAVGGVIGLFPSIVWTLFAFLRLWTETFERVMPEQTWLQFSGVVNAFSVAIPLSVAYSVVRHRVFDVAVVIRRGLQYLFAKTVLQLLLVLPLSGLVWTVIRHRHLTIAEFFLQSEVYLLWIVALGLSLRFRKQVLAWLDRRFFRQRYDSEQIVMGMVENLTSCHSIDEMSGYVFSELERVLQPTSMQLWWRDGDQLQFCSCSGPNPPAGNCPIRPALLEHLSTLGTIPVAQAGISPREARWLADCGVTLIVPLCADRVEGVLLLGAKRSEEAYTEPDRRLLHTVARQMGILRDNLRLRQKVAEEQRIRHEVLAKVEPGGAAGLLRECPRCGACGGSETETCPVDGSAMTLSLPVARIIDGRYRLDQLLGKGGMGAVYEARDLRLSRKVAVKIMLAGAFGHQGALLRFRREAYAIAMLNHPNIVSLYDFGELAGGGAYVVMERLHGVTLRAEIQRVGTFTPGAAADWFEQILTGLGVAHQRGIIHRDLKPENILGETMPSGALAVKLVDFGLAKFLSPAEGTAKPQSLTQSGAVVGTLAYMAPEQLRGDAIDQRVDIFSAGVILVEMLTGARPFHEGPLERVELRRHLTNELALLIRRCLANTPSQRFASALELQQALIPALRGSALPAQP
jgi:hypothetical protein